MTTPHQCPVCNGTGKYKDEVCHGCGGRGWVEVSDSMPSPIHHPDIPYPMKPWNPRPPVLIDRWKQGDTLIKNRCITY